MAGKLEISGYLNSLKSAVDDVLLEMLNPVRESIPERLYESMVYSLTAGGKRLRPILLISSFSVSDDDWRKALPYGVAIEYIHTYSLIHDDLPSMDDDDFRRGIPTCHKVFGEGMAILAGDALFTEAFRIFLEKRDDGISSERKIRAAHEVAKGAGASGMVGGQALDIQFSKKKADEEDVQKIHRRKTAALIRASVVSGGILSGADDNLLSLLSDYGTKIGLAFQVVDDILDVKSNFSEMGKKTGKDEAAGKATYPSVVGLKRAEEKAVKLVREARGNIAQLGERARALGEIADLCLKRKK